MKQIRRPDFFSSKLRYLIEFNQEKQNNKFSEKMNNMNNLAYLFITTLIHAYLLDKKFENMIWEEG